MGGGVGFSPGGRSAFGSELARQGLHLALRGKLDGDAPWQVEGAPTGGWEVMPECDPYLPLQSRPKQALGVGFSSIPSVRTTRQRRRVRVAGQLLHRERKKTMSKTTYCISAPFVAVCAAATIAGLPTEALAQAPEGLLKPAQATSGETNIATEGFQTAAARPEDATDAQSFTITLGGLATGGNAKNIALTSQASYRLRRAASQLSAGLAANYGRADSIEADGEVDEGYEDTVRNFQGNLRYDYFFAGPVSAFLSVTGRNDRFQQLDLRLNIDPGFAYHAISDERTRLWGEFGYDLQYDIRRQADDASTDGVDDTETRHGARAFVAYERKLSETAAFDVSMEYIQALQDTVNWRLNGGAGITAQVAESLSVATTVTVKYDNNPLPGVEKEDYVTAFNLVYQLPDGF